MFFMIYYILYHSRGWLSNRGSEVFYFDCGLGGDVGGGGAAGDSPLKREAFQNFRQRRKFGSAPAVGQSPKKKQF